MNTEGKSGPTGLLFCARLLLLLLLIPGTAEHLAETPQDVLGTGLLLLLWLLLLLLLRLGCVLLLALAAEHLSQALHQNVFRSGLLLLLLGHLTRIVLLLLLLLLRLAVPLLRIAEHLAESFQDVF